MKDKSLIIRWVASVLAVAVVLGGVLAVVSANGTKHSGAAPTTTTSQLAVTTTTTTAVPSTTTSTPTTVVTSTFDVRLQEFYSRYRETPNRSADQNKLFDQYFTTALARSTKEAIPKLDYDPIWCAQNTPDSINLDQAKTVGDTVTIKMHTFYGTTDNVITITGSKSTAQISKIECTTMNAQR